MKAKKDEVVELLNYLDGRGIIFTDESIVRENLPDNIDWKPKVDRLKQKLNDEMV